MHQQETTKKKLNNQQSREQHNQRIVHFVDIDRDCCEEECESCLPIDCEQVEEEQSSVVCSNTIIEQKTVMVVITNAEPTSGAVFNSSLFWDIAEIAEFIDSKKL